MNKPPKEPLPRDLVRECVMASHGDLARVRELLTQQPALAIACWDWGGGDFETALGAAAHTGQREIAELLLANGAHMDLFAAAMMGKLSIVKAILDDDPGARHRPGAHGIPLIVHARQGGEPADGVVAYLTNLDAAPAAPDAKVPEAG